MMKPTKIEKLHTAFMEGSEFTEAQIRKTFRLKNPRAAINTLRKTKSLVIDFYSRNNATYYYAIN